jgi:hypothetical protein
VPPVHVTVASSFGTQDWDVVMAEGAETVKHSLVLASVSFGTPLVADVNSPRQQYDPAALTVYTAEKTVGVALLTATAVPPAGTGSPPLTQPFAGTKLTVVGVQMKNLIDPDQVAAPLTSTNALSLTERLPPERDSVDEMS